MEGDADARREEGREEEGRPKDALRCDFCGATVPRVRRIALDEGYDRLQTPHPVRYACEPCSREKEAQRLGQRGR
jgi:hypothetical protein